MKGDEVSALLAKYAGEGITREDADRRLRDIERCSGGLHEQETTKEEQRKE